MADPDSQPPDEVSQREQGADVPPAGSSEPGLSGCAPPSDTELQAGGQRVQDSPGGEEEEEEEEEEGGADKASTKPRAPVLQLHRGTENTYKTVGSGSDPVANLEPVLCSQPLAGPRRSYQDHGATKNTKDHHFYKPELVSCALTRLLRINKLFYFEQWSE